jgi:hypothetical protein
MAMSLKEKIVRAVEGLSEEQQERLLQLIRTLQRGRSNPPTGRLGLKKPFWREELYEDALPH